MTKGIFIVVGIILLSVIINGAANWLESRPSSPEQKFEVVDRYDNKCDVVRYSPDYAARYFYFLDCRK